MQPETKTSLKLGVATASSAIVLCIFMGVGLLLL